MLRHIAVIAVLATTSFAWAEEAPPQAEAEQGAQAARDDAFVISGDECGASQYQHLLGREYAQVYQASMLPTDGAVHASPRMRTLEYRPQQLNVVVDGAGRIIAIGCF